MDSSLLVQKVAALIQRICDVNDTRPLYLTCFHSSEKPSISVADYLERSYKYLQCSEACFVLALVYMDRVQASSLVVIDSFSIHRIFTTSLLLAIKYLDDFGGSLPYSAKVGGISKEELLRLESDMCLILDHNLFASTEEFDQYSDVLAKCPPLSLSSTVKSYVEHDVMYYVQEQQCTTDQ